MSAAKQGVFDFAKPTLPTKTKPTFIKTINGISYHSAGKAGKAGEFPNEYKQPPVFIDEYAKMDEAEFEKAIQHKTMMDTVTYKEKTHQYYDKVANMKPWDHLPVPPEDPKYTPGKVLTHFELEQTLKGISKKAADYMDNLVKKEQLVEAIKEAGSKFYEPTKPSSSALPIEIIGMYHDHNPWEPLPPTK